MSNLKNLIEEMCLKGKSASQKLLMASTAQKNEILKKMAQKIYERKDFIQGQNHLDVIAAQKDQYPDSFIDRILLNDNRIESMAKSILDIAQQPDPIGKIITHKTLENGLNLKKICVPLGLIGVIFEARPNVVTDVCALSIKSSNAVIMRGGKEALNSNMALIHIIEEVLSEDPLFVGTCQMIPLTSREGVEVLCQQKEYLDLIIPRGGEGLIEAVCKHALVPVLKQYKGVCHAYIDESADFEKALNICENAKVQRPSVCNALEKILVHKNIAADFLPLLQKRLTSKNVSLVGCPQTCTFISTATPAKQDEWTQEYLSLKIAIKIIDNVEAAIKHINHFGSHHSDTFIGENTTSKNLFLRLVDSAIVYANASTRFSDGGVFGMGAEMGISTDKLHARGPVGLNEITSYKWIALGSGQTR